MIKEATTLEAPDNRTLTLGQKDSIQDKINKMYEIDKTEFMKTLNGIMDAPKGTLAYKMRDYWAQYAVSMNADKLYESAE